MTAAVSSPAPGPSPAARITSRGALFGLSVLTLINLLNYLDRYIVAGVMPKVLEAFHLRKEEGGLLGTVFILVYMVASPLAGVLGDRVPRRFVIAAGVFVWSLATIFSGLAPSFALLLVARGIIGVGEAGYGTVAPAVISDLFPRELRTRMLSFFYVAIPVGAAAGYALGGWIGSTWSWQAAFFVGGAPGLLLSIATLFMKEPARGAMDEAGAAAPKIAFLEGLKGLGRNAVFWPTTVGYTLMTFSIGGLSYWMPTFLEQERSMDPGLAGFAFGAVTALAGLSGTVVGGLLGDWADRRAAGGGLRLSAVGLVAAAPFMFFAARVSSATSIFALTFVAQFLLFLNSGPINAAIVNCVPSNFRAFAMGLNVLFIHLLGDAISPPLIGLVGERRTLAFAIEVNALPVLLGGVALFFAARAALRHLPQVTARPATPRG
ncbi:MAG: MFS transporter [Myxococcaceae bacterium]|nr:MFS transporter [Myxococcaceae bacterium]